MPYTMNGVGTWYYGKANVYNHADFCPYCNRYVTLSSYDTRHWGVVLFIPILPLGKKRIIDACPACTKHSSIPLKKYYKAKQEATAAAEQKCHDHPNNPEAAGELLQVYAAYQEGVLFDQTASQVLEHFPNDVKLLNTVGLIYFRSGQMEPAKHCLEQSLLLREDDEIQYLLGLIHVRLADPDAAALYFQFILDKAVHEKTAGLLTLVDAFQAQGRHQDALVWLDHIVRLNPELERDKAYKISKKLSEKHQLTGKPILNKLITSPQREKNPLSGKKAWAIAAAVFLVIGLLYVGASLYLGMRARVFLVNGLDRPYKVVLNGQSYELPKSNAQKIAVSEGTLALKVLDEALQIKPAELQLHSSFWSRPFLDRVYVINPDAMAMVEWNKVYYHENTHKAPEPEWKMYFGKQLHVFDKVQFPFEPLPQNIQSSSGSESRTQIQMFDKSAILPEQLPRIIENLFGIETKIDYMKKILLYEPDNLMNLYNLYAQADTDTFIETIRPGLDSVPIRVEWHRLYQTALETSKPDYNLTGEYKVRLDQSPDNPDLQYLYGRTLDSNRQEARHWFEQSIQHPTPCAYGHFALGYNAMVVADFSVALTHFYKAVQLCPQQPIFSEYYCKMLIATGQMDKAEAYCKNIVSLKTKDYNWLRNYLAILHQQNKHSQANQVLNQWCEQNKGIYSEADLEELHRSDRINTAYLACDFQKIREIVGDQAALPDKLLLSLSGSQPLPNDLLAQAGSFPPMWLLLCYIAESRSGSPQNADLFLSETAKQFSNGSHDERCVSQCLLSAEEPDPDRVCQLSLEPTLKAVTLTAMGIRFPQHQDRFFGLAQRLNYEKCFPYHFLASIHNGKRSQ